MRLAGASDNVIVSNMVPNGRIKHKNVNSVTRVVSMMTGNTIRGNTLTSSNFELDYGIEVRRNARRGIPAAAYASAPSPACGFTVARALPRRIMTLRTTPPRASRSGMRKET